MCVLQSLYKIKSEFGLTCVLSMGLQSVVIFLGLKKKRKRKRKKEKKKKERKKERKRKLLGGDKVFIVSNRPICNSNSNIYSNCFSLY